MSVRGQVNINFLDITETALFYRISNIFRYPVDDIDNYIDSCTFVWTHSQLNSKCREVFPKFDKLIYIIRDPRDVAISWSNFVFSPYMKRYYPFLTDNEINPQVYLTNRLNDIISDWVNHVSDYLNYRDEFKIYIVFYENFVQDFDKELQKLLNYLEIELNKVELDEIKNKVKFTTMKQENPNHVRKGNKGQWLEIFSDDQNRQVLELAKPLLQVLNYPINREESLPQLTQGFSETFSCNFGKVSLLIPTPH
ncbi:sulfotransferase domain-containing protein [Moorena sp. SIO3I6]|nr:sulfotransferase domain-containing protein [Moorena sp. SIO3I6]NEP24484.1 sulfotransferase domain-containing protein [Moorena sp. SIO3I6]